MVNGKDCEDDADDDNDDDDDKYDTNDYDYLQR